MVNNIVDNTDDLTLQDIIGNMGDTDTEDDTDNNTETDTSRPQPIVHAEKELDRSDLASNTQALLAGKIEIDGEEYALPMTIDDLNKFAQIDLNDARSAVRDTANPSALVAPGVVISGIPTVYVNEKFANAKIVASITNLTDSPIGVEECSVTGLYLEIPPENDEYGYRIDDYPDIYLPGNAGFGTSSEDMRSMYEGEFVSESASEGGFILYSGQTAKTYLLEIDNGKLYLSYARGSDDQYQKLVAIEYVLNAVQA